MSYEIKMKYAKRPKIAPPMVRAGGPRGRSVKPLPAMVWWWKMHEDGAAMAGLENIGWGSSPGNAYESALSRLKALKEQAVANR